MLHDIKKYYKDPLYRNSIAIMFNSAFAALFGLLFWIVAARTMPSSDIGLATAAISAAALIQGLSWLGMDAGLVRYLPESQDKNGIYNTVAVVTIVVAILLTSIFIIGINFFSPALGFLREGWFLPIFISYVVFSSVYSIQNTTMIAIRRADLSLVQNLILGIRIPLLFFMASIGIIGIFLSLASAFIIGFLFSVIILYKFGFSFTKHFDTITVKKMIAFSLGNYTASMLMMLPVSVLPLMIINTIGAEEGAYFYIAYSVAGLLFMIPHAISMSLFVEGSHNQPIKENVIKSIKFVMVLLLPSIIFIVLFGDQLLMLFSAEYSEKSFEILQLLAVSSVFAAIISIYTSIKRIQKDVRMLNYVSFAHSFLIISIGYISLLKYGLIGLGYAWLGSYIVICIFVIGIVVVKEKW